MENNALDTQVGGNHYKKLQMQPIELIVKANCNFIQGNIIKYVTRYKDKNGKQDIEKCIHYAHIAIEMLPDKNDYLKMGLGYSYAKANNLSLRQTNIIIATLQNDYQNVILQCEKLLKDEF